MKLNEIHDPEDRKVQLQRAMDQLKKQYAPRPQPSAEVVADRRRKFEEHQARRKRVEAALEPIAQKYKGDQFEEFKKEAEATIAPEELKLIDLSWAFDFFNPEKKAAHAQSWVEYGKARERGDPSVVGIGPGGARNWTGD
jgi:cytochrome c551/c552